MTSDSLTGTAKPVPLYMKLKQSIIEKIYTGEWKPNDRVPSEAELVKKFNCSRMTANRALRELTSEGYLIRLQGIGSFVAEAKGQSALFEIHSIADEIAARSHKHYGKVLKLEQISADLKLTLELNLALDAPVYHSVIVHYENDIPVQIEDRYVNAQAVPDYLEQDFSVLTPHDYLSQIAPLTEGEHIVEAVGADMRAAKLLNVEQDSPCLLICRRTWSKSHTITSARLLFPGHRYRLKGRFSS